jgi:acetyl esterase/lipase
MSEAPAIPESVRSLMAEVGPRWSGNTAGNVKMMIEAFTPILKGAPKEGVKVSRSQAYGRHPRQILDVYAPAGVSNAPVVIFVHGGAFVDGEKDRTEEIYSNVLYYFARQGMVGINMEFRLAPEAMYPGGAQDVGLAVAWARENVAKHGGDAKKIFIMGHSAGAAHAGLYAYDKRLWPASDAGVAGLIVVSGRVRADNLPENPNAKKVEAYFGTDTKLMEDGSPVNHVSAGSVPTFVAMAEFENPLLDMYCSELIYRLSQAKRRAPPSMWLRGHNHTSIIAHFNTAEDALGRAIVEFVRATV